jgi:hypothetical protein
MGIWILLAIALLLILLRSREGYVDVLDAEGKVIGGPGTRPSRSADWLSKIDAEASIGANDDDYLTVLQRFYDEIYLPARTTSPTALIPEATVKQFVDGVTVPGVDKASVLRIIIAGFATERPTGPGREENQIVKTGALADFEGKNLEPKMGVDQVRTRTEIPYVPADMRLGETPEGLYAPIDQQEEPRRGDYSL